MQIDDDFIVLEEVQIDFESLLAKADQNLTIWDFEEAPKELKNLSMEGGDEDWVVLIKKDFFEMKWIRFIESGNLSSVVQKFLIKDYVVLIGGH